VGSLAKYFQISDNDEVEEEVYEQGTTWKKASKDALAKREIVSVRRKKETGESKPVMPAFDFGAAAETKTETKDEAPAAPAVNAFAKFMKKEGEWDCASCEVRNPKESAKCRACEEPRAGAAGAAATPAPASAAPAPVNNAFAKFMKKADEWECASCLVTNKVGIAKCAACETPNPAAEASEKKEEAPPSGFSFGAESSSSSEAPLFTFSGDNAQFSFSADTPFTFGAGFGDAGAMSFGSVASETDKDAFKASGDANAFDESASAPADASSETSAVFKGRQAEVTGDEEDVVVYKTMCKVFQLAKVEPAQESELPVDEDDKEKQKPKEDKAKTEEGAKMSFQERGTGELNVLTREKDGKHTSRLLLRANQTHRLVLNAPIYQGIKATLEEKFVRMVSMDLDQKMSTFLLKFKNKQEASTALNHILKLSEKKA